MRMNKYLECLYEATSNSTNKCYFCKEDKKMSDWMVDTFGIIPEECAYCPGEFDEENCDDCDDHYYNDYYDDQYYDQYYDEYYEEDCEEKGKEIWRSYRDFFDGAKAWRKVV